MSDLKVFTTSGCPYCAKVKEKLDELDLEYEEEQVPHMRSRRGAVEEVSGQTGVPVLVDEDHGVEGMPESGDIVAYLEKTYGEQSAEA